MDIKKKYTLRERLIIVTKILTGIAVALIIAGFIVPPLGQIDGSILTAVGEIFAFAALWTTIIAITSGADVTIAHGQTNITIDNPDTETDEHGDN